MNRTQLRESLERHLGPFKLDHLLEELEGLDERALKEFMSKTETLSLELFLRQKRALNGEKEPLFLSPWLEVEREETLSTEKKERGRALIESGKVACVILAGGQGSRLGWHGPKALYPLFPESGCTLLDIFMQKILATSTKYQRDFSVAIMTSPLNRQSIEEYLVAKNFYGLSKERILLFEQDMMPLLDEEGKWFLDRPGSIAMGPSGNGGVFSHLMRSHIVEKWKGIGIETVMVIPIDNPLAEPFDAHLVGSLGEGDIALRCIERLDSHELIGVFAKKEGKLCVAEYFELTPAVREAVDDLGAFLFPYGNINIFSFSMKFIEQIATLELPLHIAKKKGVVWRRGEIPVSKCETFLFDVLPYAKSAYLLLCSRNTNYAPLKSREGSKDPASVRRAVSSNLASIGSIVL